MKSLFLSTCLCGFGLFAQDAASVFQKAPPAQDEALRKNASAFYQAHVDGKTRGAMSLVAEEAADAFFEMQKPKLMSFEIQGIKYDKGFEQAAVMVLAEREVAVPFGGNQVMKIPMESYWKKVGGEWRWFLPKGDCKTTPFGCVPTNGAAADPKAAEKMGDKIKAGFKAMDGELGFEKTFIELKTGGEVELTFSNGMPGYVHTKFWQPFNDPEIELINAEQQFAANTKGTIKIRVKPGVTVAKGREVMIPLWIEPFHRRAGLRVNLQP